MARLPRLFVKGMVQHVIVRGKDLRDVFLGEADYLFYLSCLEDTTERYNCHIHAYVLMPNHLHLLVSPESKESLSRTLQSIGRRYVQYYNQVFGRSGSLWDSRYKATVIDTDRYLLTCMRYIELNPVRAMQVKHPKLYPWSSYRHNAWGETNRLLTPHILYRKLGRSAAARQAAYRLLFKSRITSIDLEAIRYATNQGWALGDDKFKDRLQTFTKRRVKPLPKGRPRLKKLEDRTISSRIKATQAVRQIEGSTSI